MSGFASGEQVGGEFASYSVVDERNLRMTLSSRDFIQAFTVSLRMLGACFVYPPVEGGSLGALQTIRGMDVMQNWPFGHGKPLMRTMMLLAQGQMEPPEYLEREFRRLFYGEGDRVAPPFGSAIMCDEGQGDKWTLQALRDWLHARGINPLYDENDPEDQFGRLLVLAAELASARPDWLAEFLGDHLLCWSGRFLELFQTDNLPATYRGLAMLTAITLEDAQETLGIIPAERKFYI